MNKQYEEKLETQLREAFWAYENALGTELAAGVVFRATSDFTGFRDEIQALCEDTAKPTKKYIHEFSVEDAEKLLNG